MAGRPRKELAFQEQDEENDVELLERPQKQVITPSIKVPAKMVLKLRAEQSGIKRHGKVVLDGIDDVFDPVTGETRRMRLLRGAKSIWQDEQYNFTKDYVGKNRMSLEFENETCVLNNSPQESLQKQFAILSNANWDNENKAGTKKIYFEIWNPEAISEKALQEDIRLIEAITLAAQQPYEKMKRHAVYLGVSLIDEVSGHEAKETQIRQRYMLKAKADPKKFLQSADKEITDIAYFVKQGIAETKIDTTKQRGHAYWNDGGYICAIPSGEHPQEYLVKFAMLKGEESVMFKTQLKSLYQNS